MVTNGAAVRLRQAHSKDPLIVDPNLIAALSEWKDTKDKTFTRIYMQNSNACWDIEGTVETVSFKLENPNYPE